MTNQDVLNEMEILNRFYDYLQESNVNDALAGILDDAEDEEFTNEEVQVMIGEILIPEVVILFTDKVLMMDNCYDYDSNDENSLQEIFDTFCIQNISTDFANLIASAINEAAASDEDDEAQFAKISNKERSAKVKAFLKKLAQSGLDAKDLKPFFRNSIGDQSDPYGNQFGKNVTKGDHYGSDHKPNYDDDDIDSPRPLKAGIAINREEHEEDPFHRAHELHRTLAKFNFKYHATSPVYQRVGSRLVKNFVHSWKNKEHIVSALEGSDHWSSKTSDASIHTTTGIGVHALAKHLHLKSKRYKLPFPNEETLSTIPIIEGSLPHNELTENLLDPASYDRVQAYADWINKHNPGAVLGHHIEQESPAQALIEAAKHKEYQQKFGIGLDGSKFPGEK
jgi:hypothetical protein